DKATRMALPEVLLGVIPGWGGTQRLPRLVGLEQSLDLILTGKAVDTRKALKIGLADKKAPPEFLEEKALAWAKELGERGKKRSKESEAKRHFLEKVPGGRWIMLDQAKKQVLKRT